MNTKDKIAVCSRSFSKNPILRSDLLNKYSNVTFNDMGKALDNQDLYEFLLGHDKAIIALEQIDSQLLNKLPDLKVISKYGVGLDSIQMDAMRRYKIKLGWTGGVNSRSVSELVISLSINLLRHISEANKNVIAGNWFQLMGSQLTRKKFGIIGCGQVGKDLVKLLQPFNCEILVNDIIEYTDFYKQYGVKAMPLEELLSYSDIVSLHVPLDNSTLEMLSKDRLLLMKPTSILINLARGGLVDEIFLTKILTENKIAGAAFDVFLSEPPLNQNLLELTNFISTPHIGGSSKEAVLAMGSAAIKGLDNNEIPSKLIFP